MWISAAHNVCDFVFASFDFKLVTNNSMIVIVCFYIYYNIQLLNIAMHCTVQLYLPFSDHDKFKSCYTSNQ